MKGGKRKLLSETNVNVQRKRDKEMLGEGRKRESRKRRKKKVEKRETGGTVGKKLGEKGIYLTKSSPNKRYSAHFEWR